MTRYPLSFSAQGQTAAALQSSWDVSAGPFSTSCAIPPEFDGPGRAPSPEDFFVLALSNCFIATFKVFAHASSLAFESIEFKANLVIDRVTPGQAVAKECTIDVQVVGAQNAARAATILKKVAKSGILLNSVKTELNFKFTVNGESIL